MYVLHSHCTGAASSARCLFVPHVRPSDLTEEGAAYISATDYAAAIRSDPVTMDVLGHHGHTTD